MILLTNSKQPDTKTIAIFVDPNIASLAIALHRSESTMRPRLFVDSTASLWQDALLRNDIYLRQQGLVKL